MPESPLYLDHQETGCLISASLGSRVQRRGWSSLLRPPVKFGQVTVTCRRPRPPRRTGSQEQEVIVSDVRRCKDRENESLCLSKSTSEDFCLPESTILKQIFSFFFFFLFKKNKEHEAQYDLRTFGTFFSGGLRFSRWEMYLFQPKMGSFSHGWSFVRVLLVNSSHVGGAIWNRRNSGVIFQEGQVGVMNSQLRGITRYLRTLALTTHLAEIRWIRFNADLWTLHFHALWGVYGASWRHRLIVASLIIYPTICWCSVIHSCCFKRVFFLFWLNTVHLP